MSRSKGSLRARAWAALLAVLACGCHSLLDVPVPRGVVDPGSLTGKGGAESLRAGAIGLLAAAADGGFDVYTGMLSDEYRQAIGGQQAEQVDSRTLPENVPLLFDTVYAMLQLTRIQAGLAVNALEAVGASVSAPDVAETFAIEGYAHLLLAESMCSGVPLSTVTTSGAVTNGAPISTDSLLSTAITLFDSARVHAGVGDTIAFLAAIGAGRAWLDRGQPAKAATQVVAVPLDFAYVTQLVGTNTGFYYELNAIADQETVGDREGTNGLDFVSAADPRVPLTSRGTTDNGIPWFMPTMFIPPANGNAAIVLASGIEAQLIMAEAALQSGNTSAWLTAINGLRANAISPAMPPITDPGSAPARIDSLFTERAFWLFGTGHRLGDLRRLVKWYGRNQAAVFPTGTFYNGNSVGQYPTYGTDVNFPTPISEKVNPNFHGCLGRDA